MQVDENFIELERPRVVSFNWCWGRFMMRDHVVYDSRINADDPLEFHLQTFAFRFLGSLIDFRQPE